MMGSGETGMHCVRYLVFGDLPYGVIGGESVELLGNGSYEVEMPIMDVEKYHELGTSAQSIVQTSYAYT